MADKYFLTIIDKMDTLWYHQIILFSKPTSPLATKHVQKHVPISEPSSNSSSSSSILSLPPLLDEETSTDESLSSQQHVSSDSIISLPLQDGLIDNKEEFKDILDKMSHLGDRNCSQSTCSSLPTTRNHHRKSRKQGKLEKSMSCRTLGELELDEVKGFMDLGFIFKKECISPRIISVVPGLQRLCLYQSESQVMDDATENGDDDDDIVEVCEEEKRDVMRPYLSEAWLIKRPDSPLLNLKVPKSCSGDNMKKHLKVWAKIVASEIKQQ